MLGERVPALEAWLCETLGARRVRIRETRALSGGAIQENWLLGCLVETSGGADQRRFVLRRDSPAVIGSSLSRAEEFAILRVAHETGVLVPEPVGFCNDPEVIGSPFALTGFVPGEALGARVVKDTRLGGDREALVHRLGQELAKVHSIRPPHPALGFLGAPDPEPARREVTRIRQALDTLGVVRPVIEWGLRFAEVGAPACPEVRLLHGDFRTGNYLLGETGLGAILDWEFASWGDPMADLGWFTAACWRFGRPELEAGGIGSRAAFYDGYRGAGEVEIDDAAVHYWELMAHLRWALIALEQGERHLSGVQPSLELALTGRVVAELELAILRATRPETWSFCDDR